MLFVFVFGCKCARHVFCMPSIYITLVLVNTTMSHAEHIHRTRQGAILGWGEGEQTEILYMGQGGGGVQESRGRKAVEAIPVFIICIIVPLAG